MAIISINNKKIKEILKLKDIKQIKKNKKYIIDGLHLVQEALKSNCVEEIFISENFPKELDLPTNIKITTVDQKISKLIAETVNNQGIFAICSIENKYFNINNYRNIIILDRIQDPGNLGTIIRTADAFNFDCVILGQGTTSLYSQKAIRSMQGSNFHIDCFDNINIPSLLNELTNFDVLATSLQSSEYLEEMTEISEKYAIIFGNEANGISEEIVSKVNKKIKIRILGEAESLNVAVASGIIMHHIKNIIK